MYVRTDMKSGAACYTVQSGDNLSKIAQRFYGNMSAEQRQQDLLLQPHHHRPEPESDLRRAETVHP